MKQKFLELVKETEKTGIVSALLKSSSAEEAKKAWKKFEADNEELFTKIIDWANEYRESGKENLFQSEEKIDNPIEIAVIIYIIGDEDTSECEIFSDYEDLVNAINEIDGDFAKGLAKIANSYYIYLITAEGIFDPDSFSPDDVGEEDEDFDLDEDDEETGTEDDEDNDSDEDAEEEDSES